MAVRSFQFATYTPTATADTTNLAGQTFQAIGVNTITQGLQVDEVMISGQATSSSLAIAQFARDHVLGATVSPLQAPQSDGPLMSATLPTQLTTTTTYCQGTTAPQRSAVTTSARLNLAINAFGGIVRWNAAPGQNWFIFGTGIDVSESSLSYFTGGGTGAVGSHVLYEPF